MMEAMGGVISAIIIMVMTLITMPILIYYTLYTVQWGEEFRDGEDSMPTLMIILAFSFLSGLSLGLRGIIYFFQGVRMSREIHSRMSFRVIHSRVTDFLQRIPFGQLLNRFSNDIDIIDRRIPQLIGYVTIIVLVVIVDLVAVVLASGNYFFIIPCVAYIVLGVWYRTRFMRAQREVMRLYSISKSPISGWGEAMVKGAPILRTLGKQEYAGGKMDLIIEENMKNLVVKEAIIVWFNDRMAIWGWIIVLLPAYIYVILKFRTDETINYANFVLLVIRTSSLASDFDILVANSSNLELDAIAIERCKGFEEIKPESNYKTLKLDQKEYEFNLKKEFDCLDAKRWKDKRVFKSGKIEVRNVTASYPTREEPILKSINVVLNPGEKVGIIGRTGAGKSSFIKLFSRILTPDSGKVLIDDIDLASMDLKILRDQITTISQNSALFEGTLKENIDPYLKDKSKVKEIEERLKELNFTSPEFTKLGLDMKILPNGDNLSQGEKQIVSFVRALNKNRKVVIFDEATADLDMETEKLFQGMIDLHFEGSTMIVIAHRIQTVLKCDRILVFDNGSVTEMMRPSQGNRPGELIRD